jgi:hypothetical protein
MVFVSACGLAQVHEVDDCCCCEAEKRSSQEIQKGTPSVGVALARSREMLVAVTSGDKAGCRDGEDRIDRLTIPRNRAGIAA